MVGAKTTATETSSQAIGTRVLFLEIGDKNGIERWIEGVSVGVKGEVEDGSRMNSE